MKSIFSAMILGVIFCLPAERGTALAQVAVAHREGANAQGQGVIVMEQGAMTNVPGRTTISLNGRWKAIIDVVDAGKNRGFWKDARPTGKSDFYEYSFDQDISLNVPGDFNSQLPELKYYESTVWYKRSFSYNLSHGKRVFVHFGAVNYIADVYLNGEKLGSHEGGFTPFQFEITGKLREGDNTLIVRVNNERRADGLPAVDYDWWNYGGITRDVNLIVTPEAFIEDYFIHLAHPGAGNKSSGADAADTIEGWVQLNGSKAGEQVRLSVPGLKIDHLLTTDSSGKAAFHIKAKPALWTPDDPKLYKVVFRTALDSIAEDIGFRNISVHGSEILLNGKPIFLKGINFHEENPQRGARAYSESDALELLTWAKELGCNFVRLPHYPQNEYTVRMAERMGIMLWEEIPIWQNIRFGDTVVKRKAMSFMNEMVSRDRNRCGVIIWSLSNETAPSPVRDKFLADLAGYTRSLDPTRLITSAFNHLQYDQNKIIIADTLARCLDVVGVNEYIGWYGPWKYPPGDLVWENPSDKPVIMSEFGGEALYGRHGSADTASSWSEEYQEKLYLDQLTMLKRIPFLRGTCPWILADFRSPSRMLPNLQDGWNRKGLVSDKGFRKKAWYVLKAWYDAL
jgi:beta-glucuronidase